MGGKGVGNMSWYIGQATKLTGATAAEAVGEVTFYLRLFLLLLVKLSVGLVLAGSLLWEAIDLKKSE